MLNIHTIPLGLLGTNCYIVRQGDSDHCLVIDPGQEPEPLLQWLEETGYKVDAILLTHGHFDHVGGVRELVAEADCPVYLNTADLVLPPRMTDGPLYYSHPYQEGMDLTLAGIPVTVLDTPGHTPGSVCLILEDCLFSGDTLFAGACGRTDFPGGSLQQMYASLDRLARLPGNYRVFPGHGESTTLAAEKQYNPFMN